MTVIFVFFILLSFIFGIALWQEWKVFKIFTKNNQFTQKKITRKETEARLFEIEDELLRLHYGRIYGRCDVDHGAHEKIMNLENEKSVLEKSLEREY